MNNKAPLGKWPALRTSSLAAAEQALHSVYGARHFESAKTAQQFFAHANYKSLNAISFSYCSYTTPVTIQFPEAPFYQQAFSRGGSGILTGAGREWEIPEQ